jgi:hypothetical protein
MKPQIEITAAITRPTHDTDLGTENGPICTVHRFNSLIRWPIATTAKISAEIATYVDILCSLASARYLDAGSDQRSAWAEQASAVCCMTACAKTGLMHRRKNSTR